MIYRSFAHVYLGRICTICRICYFPAGDCHIPVSDIWYWCRYHNRNSNLATRLFVFYTRSELRIYQYMTALGDCRSWWLPIKLSCTHYPTLRAHNDVELKQSIRISMANAGDSSSSGSAAGRRWSRQGAARRFLCGSWSRSDGIYFCRTCMDVFPCKLYLDKTCSGTRTRLRLPGCILHDLDRSCSHTFAKVASEWFIFAHTLMCSRVESVWSARDWIMFCFSVWSVWSIWIMFSGWDLYHRALTHMFSSSGSVWSRYFAEVYLDGICWSAWSARVCRLWFIGFADGICMI